MSQPLIPIKRTFLRSNASDVTNLDTLLEIVPQDQSLKQLLQMLRPLLLKENLVKTLRGSYLFLHSLAMFLQTVTRLIDSGASHHITGYREHLSNLKENGSYLQVIIGDDACYSMKGANSTSFQLDSKSLFI